MNRWAQMLAELPPTLQRQIARAQRVSLPRSCDPAERHARLRRALCRPAAVRSAYFALPPVEQAALQHLRACPRGLDPAELVERFGPLRPWSAIAADPAPQSLSERLVLLGWLLPRPAAPRHPPRFLLPPELRAALPHPLALADHGPAPAPGLPPALRAAHAILLAAAERPLPLCHNGAPRLPALRVLARRLAPCAEDEALPLLRFVMPLLIDLGLLAPHGADAALAPAGRRFLALPPPEQLTRLRAAWVRAPRPDQWLALVAPDLRGLDLPLFRRRLLAWAAALPTGRLLAADGLFPALADALGPLADAQTHGFRPVDRAPWQPRRAARVWDAALRGPLSWLGCIAWPGPSPQLCAATPFARADLADDEQAHAAEAAAPASAPAEPPPWRYGAPGEVQIPHAAVDQAALGLLPYARWSAANETDATYTVTARGLAAAVEAGHSYAALLALLERRAGPPPPVWRAGLPLVPDAVRIIHTAVVLSDDPAVLDRAAAEPGVRRYLDAHLAPGIALAQPERAEALARTLARRDLAVIRAGDPAVPPPAELSPAECATLLAACAAYSAERPDALPALAAVEERLRAALPPALRAIPVMSEADTQRLPPATPPAPPATGEPAPPAPGGDGRRLVVGRTLRHSHVELVCAVLIRLVVTPLLLLCALLVPGRALARRRQVRSHQEGAPAPRASQLAPAAGPPPPVDSSAALALLRRAIDRRQAVRISYATPQDERPTTRIVRPLRLEGHGSLWYLHAFCTRHQEERCFRLDRIAALELLPNAPPKAPPRRRPPPRRGARPRRQAPRAGFFPPPPAPPPGSPLVRIWLDEG